MQKLPLATFDAVNFLQARIQTLSILVSEKNHPMRKPLINVLPCLVSESGHVYEFIRTLRKCIYGKVKHAVLLEKVNPEENQLNTTLMFRRTTTEVAIKVMSKAIIQQGHLQENPMVELMCQQHLGNPGML